MKRAVVVLLPSLFFLYACTSSTPAPNGEEDSGGLAPLDDGGGFDVSTPVVDATLPVADAAPDTGSPAMGGDTGAPDSKSPADSGAPDATVDSGLDSGTDSGVDTGTTVMDSGIADSDVPDAALATACGNWASNFCEDFFACSTTQYELGAVWSGTIECGDRLLTSCIASLEAPGSTQTAAATQACATAIGNLTVSCAAFRSGNLGAVCATSPGTVANAGSCAFNTQCVSTFCAIAPNTVCGTCQPVTTVGGACANGACISGQACDTKTGLCVAIDSVTAGGSCDVSEQCNLLNGTACDPEAGTCTVALAYQQFDAGCGLRDDGGLSQVVCRGSGECSSVVAPGTCSPPAADGTACTTDGGTNCFPPAACVGGTCTFPSAALCP